MTAQQIDWRGVDSAATQAMQLAADAAKKANTAAFAWSATGSIVYSTSVALSLAAREAVIPVTDANVGDRVQIFRAARPQLSGVDVIAGVIIECHATVWEAGKVPIVHTIPAVGVGQTLSIPLILIGYRPAA